jgi:Stress responsive A/B Barrel Domain
MIQHIMLWNYKDGLASDERAKVESELIALAGKVASIVSLEYGPVVGGRNQTFEYCFVMRFNDKEGLSEYTTHPAHLDFAPLFKGACTVQVVTDFEEVGH